MRKSEFHGWTDVFRFTLVETWKNRSFLIFMIITWILGFIAIPVMSMITGAKDGKKAEYEFEKVTIEKVYVLDDVQFTDIGFNAAVFQKEEVFKDIPVVTIHGKTYKEVTEIIDEEPNSVLIHITLDMASGVSFDIVRAIESKVSTKECDYIGQCLTEEFATFKYEVTGMGEEQLKVLDYGYDVVTLMETDNGEFISEKAHISSAKYWVVYVILFVVMMVSIMASSQVATAVAMDKSTRVMEYLLTSVRPMALVFGKVIAQVVSTILQLGITFGLALVSNVIMKGITGKNFLQTKLPDGIFESLTVPNCLVAFVAIAGGVMLYGFVAGLCGAMVRKMEEMQESMTMISILSMIGAYLAMFAAMTMQSSISNPLFYAAILIPISSPFLLPGVCLIGVGAWWLKLLSLAIILVVDVIILFTSARVYEILILYNGSKIKWKDLFRFLKQAKGGKTA